MTAGGSGGPGGPRRGRGLMIFGAALLAGALAAGVAIVVVDQVRSEDAEESNDGGVRDEDPDGGEESDDPGEDIELDPVEVPDDEALEAAVSETREDSVYPEVGDPIVDALHYAIDFSWFPESGDEFTATTQVTFRATAARDDFQLDLAEDLEVDSVEVDGTEVDFAHEGKDLIVASPVVADARYRVVVVYGGAPEPTEAPTTRSDFDGGLGLTRSESPATEGWLWTMQEPYGAFTWYPVNDQPADKALYDVTVHTQAGWSGVSNGVVVEQEENDDVSVTRFHSDAPMSSYLTTLAVGEYELTEDLSDSGVPLTYWTPVGDTFALDALQETKAALAFVEEHLGEYPFSSLGAVVVDSESAMETQTMITYGNTDYALSPETLVHEIAHQWYGDKVSPNDWSEVWMNEGMATYIQIVFEAETYGADLDEYVGYYAGENASLRAEAGPPAAYDPMRFAESNIYIIPAVMWHQLRRDIGDESFWQMVRAWPSRPGYVSTGREEYWPWVSEEVGIDLTDFFNAWLVEEEQPGTSF